MKLIVGSYSNPESPGIYLLDWNETEFRMLDKFSGIENPSYLHFDKEEHLWYAISECDDSPSTFYRIECHKDILRIVDAVNYPGKGTCHIFKHKNMVFLANYISGSFTYGRSSGKGEIAWRFNEIKFAGKGFDVERQTQSHVHMVGIDPTRDLIFVADLGTDKCFVYKVENLLSEVTDAPLKTLDLPPGSGPRQFVFDANYSKLYLLCELSAEIFTFDLNCLASKWVHKTSIISEKNAFSPNKLAGAIALHPSGKFLYTTLRGDYNLIVVFKIEENGLQEVQHVSSKGKSPRDLSISGCGLWLITANQNSGHLTTYQINIENGFLTYVNCLALDKVSYVNFIKNP